MADLLARLVSLKDKKGISLSINLVVIVVVALLLMAIVIFIITRYTGNFQEGTSTCATGDGKQQCFVHDCGSQTASEYPIKVFTATCPDSSFGGQQYCCRQI